MTSTAARRIARKINATRARNLDSGCIVCDADGNGGAYYTGNARPTLAAGESAWDVSRRATAAGVQAELDASAEF